MIVIRNYALLANWILALAWLATSNMHPPTVHGAVYFNRVSTFDVGD